MVELYCLMFFMIVAAVLAIELKDLVSSVVSLAALGLVLCITFIVLKAPEVAIMQLVVETLALVILIKATLRSDLPFSASGRWYFNTTIYFAFFITLIIIALECFKDMPPFGHPLMRVSSTYLKEGLSSTGAANVVSAVTLDFRAFDTLCEATILFVAVLGVLVIVRPKGRKAETELLTEGEDE